MSDATLVYGWRETDEEALARNKELYVSGLLSLREFEGRVERILAEWPWPKEMP